MGQKGRYHGDTTSGDCDGIDPRPIPTVLLVTSSVPGLLVASICLSVECLHSPFQALYPRLTIYLCSLRHSSIAHENRRLADSQAKVGKSESRRIMEVGSLVDMV